MAGGDDASLTAREPAPPYRGEGPHALWHVSEDDSIRVFRPHRAPTALVDELRVWAVDTRHLPFFWFPRDCPRGTYWASGRTADADVGRFLDDDRNRRVHAIQSEWLAAMRLARVVAYRLPEEPFVPDPDVGGYWVAREEVVPLEVVPLGDLLALHAESRIELRIVPDLRRLWQRVIESTLEFSGMRLRNLD